MTHEERVFHHMYETNEGIEQQSKRIANLEELVLDMMALLDETCDTFFENEYEALNERMEELEVRP